MTAARWRDHGPSWSQTEVPTPARRDHECVTPAGSETPEDYFAGHPGAWAAFSKVRAMVEQDGPIEVRVSRSQVAFWRKRGFAYLWMPGQYLKHPGAEVVLSIALGRLDGSDRFKEVAHPSPAHWMHHLEVHTLTDLDGEVAEWLHEAAAWAG